MAENLPAVSLPDMYRMAESVAKSGLFGVKTADQALALMAIAQAEGRHPASAAQDYHIIQNRPAKKSEAMLRDHILSGGKVQWHELNDGAADATFSHPAGGEVRIRWDLARAKGAGLLDKDIWKKYPRQMLRSRTVSEGVRTVNPLATSGMYVPEEVQDMEPVAESQAAKLNQKFAGKQIEAQPVEVIEAEIIDEDKELFAELLKRLNDASGKKESLIEAWEIVNTQKDNLSARQYQELLKTKQALKEKLEMKLAEEKGKV